MKDVKIIFNILQHTFWGIEANAHPQTMTNGSQMAVLAVIARVLPAEFHLFFIYTFKVLVHRMVDSPAGPQVKEETHITHPHGVPQV